MITWVSFSVKSVDKCCKVCPTQQTYYVGALHCPKSYMWTWNQFSTCHRNIKPLINKPHNSTWWKKKRNTKKTAPQISTFSARKQTSSVLIPGPLIVKLTYAPNLRTCGRPPYNQSEQTSCVWSALSLLSSSAPTCFPSADEWVGQIRGTRLAFWRQKPPSSAEVRRDS